MFSGHFYHGTLRKIVSVFGTLFNNLSVVRKDAAGNVTSVVRVPLAYGPRQKFLARISEKPDVTTDGVAIKLPRMSFEITSLTYDTISKINNTNTVIAQNSSDPFVRNSVRAGVPYRIGMQLNIIAKNQDDALQLVEQIFPYFQPEYTVTVKDVDGTNIKNDIPIVLMSVGFSDDYEGDFMSRRAIIYTLDFEMRVRFYGNVVKQKVIKAAAVDIAIGDEGTPPTETITVGVNPSTARPTDNPNTYEIITSINYLPLSSSWQITTGGGTGTFVANEIVVGNTSGTTGTIFSVAGNTIMLNQASGLFIPGEQLRGFTSGASKTISTAVQTFD